MASAYSGWAATLHLGSAVVVGVTDIGGPNITTTTIDASSRDSLARLFVPGMYDPGELTLGIVYDPDAATHLAISTAQAAGTMLTGVLTLPDTTPAKSLTFDCFVSDFAVKAPMDDALTADITLKLSGAATFVSTATWTVTTAGAATHTIAAFTVSASTVVDWGDGSATTYAAGAGARTHDYAGAGTWTVRVLLPLNVTALTLSDDKVTLNSSGIASMVNMVAFEATAVKAGTFNSSDVSAWRPIDFRLHTMPAGYAGTLNSTDLSVWRPTIFMVYNMPADYAGVFNTTHLSAWRPTDFFLNSMPVATFTITITANGFALWTALTAFQMKDNSFSEAQVNALLWDLYQAAKAPRIGVAGTINISNSNAAPSGTFQACASLPVTNATPGKEIAHELINDTGNAFANHWTTVTTTA